MYRLALLVLLNALLLLCGCTNILTNFTALGTKQAPLLFKTAQPTQGRSCHSLLFGVIPLTDTPSASLTQAIDRALEQGGGELLVDGLVYEEELKLPLLYEKRCYVVEGTAVTLKRREVGRSG